MTVNSVPDFRAISYSLQNYTQYYSDAADSVINQNLNAFPNNYITIENVPLDNVTAWDLKTAVPYKQYQLCFIQQYVNPYERVVDNKTEVSLGVLKDQVLNT
jgi:hypothetical protein